MGDSGSGSGSNGTGPNRIGGLLARSGGGGARSKVAIVGYTAHRNLAPFADDSFEIWGLNDLYYELPIIAPDRMRWFQLHSWAGDQPHDPNGVRRSPVDFQSGPPHPRDPNHVLWLKEQAERIPVYLLEPRAEVPNARLFPLEQAFRHFSLDGVKPNRYFTNTISYMLALAIMEGFTEIGIYGVDMMMGGGAGSEYGWQRPSCEYFVGVAQGRGITVHIPDESDLLKCAYPYGLSTANPYRIKQQAMLAEYRARRNELQSQRAQCDAGNSELTGAISQIESQLACWMPGDGEESIGRVPVPNGHLGVRPVAPQYDTLKQQQLPPSPPQHVTIDGAQLEHAVMTTLHKLGIIEPAPVAAAEVAQ